MTKKRYHYHLFSSSTGPNWASRFAALQQHLQSHFFFKICICWIFLTNNIILMRPQYGTNCAEFSANTADRSGSICAFKRHKNREKRRDFRLWSDRFQTTPKSWKMASIIDEIRLQADLINNRSVFHDFGVVWKRSDHTRKSRRFLWFQCRLKAQIKPLRSAAFAGNSAQSAPY